MREDERRWMKSYIIESKFLSSLRLQSKGALAIPTLQSWRRLDGKWCGKMQYSDRTSWTFIVHRAKNLNLTRINVFFAFWYGLCIIEEASSIHDIYIYNMTHMTQYDYARKGQQVLKGSINWCLLQKGFMAFHGTSSSAEACEDEASYYLAFELCTGGTLLEAIEDRYAGEWEDCVHATRTRSCWNMSGNMSRYWWKIQTQRTTHNFR